MGIVREILKRCDRGWTLAQKIGLTLLLAIYWLSPIDFIPDIFPILGQCDDVFLTYCLFRVWRSPTLPPTTAAST
ncbi:MAG: DUF1232 domain-containing protein [Phycisphaerales bacterium]